MRTFMSHVASLSGTPLGKVLRPPAVLPLLLLVAIALAGAVGVAGEVIDEDLIIDTPVDWTDAQYTISANITVVSGGVLNITDATLTFVSPEDAPIGLEIGPEGALLMTGVTCQAVDHPFIISSSGDTTIVSSSFSGLYSVLEDAGIAGLVGGIVAEGGDLVLEDVTIESEGVALSLFGTNFTVDGLNVTGGTFGILAFNSEGTLANIEMFDIGMAFAMQGTTVDMVDIEATQVNWTLWAMVSNITVSNMLSRSSGDHVSLENCTTVITDSEFEGGDVGALSILGYLEVVRCWFHNLSTGVELIYAEGKVVDVLVENPYDVGIVLNFIGYSAETPRFEFDNVTIVRGTEAAIDIESSDITLTNLTIEGCGNGLDISSSTVVLRDALITGSTQCRPFGCSYTATGTGIALETASIDMFNVTIDGSNGPAISSTFSLINATSSRFINGNLSGLLMVYSAVNLHSSAIRDNAFWGIESLGYDIDPEELDVIWGNGLADLRMNMTINVKVFDDHGMWLSHADVTATSSGVTVGPYTTGFGGSSQTFELPLYEWTDGASDHSFNPWTFTVVYGNFDNATDVDLVLGLEQIDLIVPVPRADLVIDGIKAPGNIVPEEVATIRATVTNSGNHIVDNAVLTFYYRNADGFQRVIGETSVGPMAPGESEEGSVNWIPDIEGKYTIVAFVDVDDDVDEENEDNNRMERELEVSEEAGNGVPGPSALVAVAALAVVALGLMSMSVGGRRD
jgi:hypothetical protein